MAKKRIHLVCNAHLDPVWLWPWEDGLTEALSTYRIAADFCEQYDGFVFNHNEVLLYRWVEKYEPALFKRIQKLVKQGRWHIAGGAYLQPDVNNTSGETHIRHFLHGRQYFEHTFNTYPKTAYNFDPFGHAEGFPQILKGCGMERYIFCRPSLGDHKLPVGAFEWVDRSGSRVITRRSDDHYLTNGQIAAQLDRFLPHYAEEPETMILWGIGNHGGGPSRAEYAALQKYIAEHPEYHFVESTPDGFFDGLLSHRPDLPTVRGEIQHAFPGCFTSMSRVKRGHRAAESAMASAERLSTLSYWWDCAPYPKDGLDIAWRDIMFAEFHDILPGSGIPSVERDSVQLLAHAQEKLRRVQFDAIHSLICRDTPGKDGDIPVFIANPHGFPLARQIEIEFNLHHNQSAIRNPEVLLQKDGKPFAFQRMQAEACCAGNWRVRLSVFLQLNPWEIARLDASFVNDRGKPYIVPKANREALSFKTRRFDLAINPRTGLIDHLSLPKGPSLVKKGALCPVLFDDLDHSWTCGDPGKLKTFRVGAAAPGGDAPVATFRLATKDEAAALSPPAQDKWSERKTTTAHPIRIIENGTLKTVVEALFVCDASAIVRQYHIGHPEGSLEIRDRVFYNHRDKMLKLMSHLNFEVSHSLSESLYSAQERQPTPCHEDQMNQRWAAVCGKQSGKAVFFAIANTGSGAHSLTKTEWAVNVLRSPAYSSFNINPGDARLNNRFLPRQDQGEHEMRYEIILGRRFDETAVSRTAQALNTPPIWQVYYPQGASVETKRRPNLTETVAIADEQVQIVALKKAEHGEALIVRLQDTGGKDRDITLRVKPFQGLIKTHIRAFGLITLSIKKGGKKLSWREVNLVEREAD